MPSVPKSPREGGSLQGDFASLAGRTYPFKNRFRSLDREIFAFKFRFGSLDREIFAFKNRFRSLDPKIFAFKNCFRSLKPKIFVFGRLFGSLAGRLPPLGVASEVSVGGGRGLESVRKSHGGDPYVRASVRKSRRNAFRLPTSLPQSRWERGVFRSRFGSLGRRGAFPAAQQKAPRGNRRAF